MGERGGCYNTRRDDVSPASHPNDSRQDNAHTAQTTYVPPGNQRVPQNNHLLPWRKHC